MNNPQREHGHIQIATGAADNDLIMALVRAPLTATEYKIALFVLRKTWGYGKKEDRISLSQFEKNIGLPRRTVCRSIVSLVDKRILVTAKTLPITTYGFNKRFNDWVVSSSSLGTEQTLGVVTPVTAASDRTDRRVVTPRTHTKENVTKDIYTKESGLKKITKDDVATWTDEQLQKLGKDFLKQATAITDEHYAKKTWDQRVNLRHENRIEFYRKISLFCGYSRSRSEKMIGKARVLFAEIAGFVNDRGAMEKVLDDKEALKRRELHLEETGPDYVRSELGATPTIPDEEIF